LTITPVRQLSVLPSIGYDTLTTFQKPHIPSCLPLRQAVRTIKSHSSMQVADVDRTGDQSLEGL